jgi:AAA family ATP:ADP antiporter
MTDRPARRSIKEMFLPIMPNEYKKFFPLALMMSSATGTYAVLRFVKDFLVLTAEKGGAEAIYATKLIAVIPSMIIIKVVYDKLSEKVDREPRFLCVLMYFFAFFSLFLFVLYPNRRELEMVAFSDKLMNTPILNRFSSIWLVFRYWHIALFYIHAEAWGTFVLGVGLWSFIIYVTNLKQSKRFFTSLSVGSGLATALAGLLAFREDLFTIENLLQIVLINIFLLMLLYRFFARAVSSDPREYEIEETAIKKKKVKLSLWESFAIVIRSPYFLRILILVCCYTTSMALTESVYRKGLQESAAGDKIVIRMFGAIQLLAIGLLQILFIPIIRPILKRSWRFTASILPVLTLVGTLISFGFLFLHNNIASVLGIDPNQIFRAAIILQLIIIICLKVLKYLLFDPTKGRLLQVEEESRRIVGQSAVDGVGSRFGKGIGGFLVTMVLVPLFGSITKARPLIAVAIILTIITWLWVVESLSIRFEKRLKIREKEVKNESKAAKNS